MSLVKDLKFAVAQKVFIAELKIPGRIVGIYIGVNCIRYEVRYFDNASAHTEYFFEDEIQCLEG